MGAEAYTKRKWLEEEPASWFLFSSPAYLQEERKENYVVYSGQHINKER